MVGPAEPDAGAAEYRFSIESSFENVADLAERIGALTNRQRGAGADVADCLRLCLAEAMNNIVEHAYDGKHGRMIYAEVVVGQELCTIQLIDEGKPMPGGAAPEGVIDFDADDIEHLPEGGFGWMLIRTQMDAIDYHRRDGCNVLRLEKRLAG